MIKFLPLNILSLLQISPGKIKNFVYFLQISALVPKIFKFEKCAEYANEMTDEVIYTQYSIKYTTNRAFSVNLQQRPLKLGRLIVL